MKRDQKRMLQTSLHAQWAVVPKKHSKPFGSGNLLGILIFCTLLWFSVIVSAEEYAQEANDAWRHDMAIFANEVLSLVENSEIPKTFQLLESIRERTVFQNDNGEDAWVVLKQGFDKEFHGVVLKHFSGHVAWRGPVESVKTDPEEQSHIIEVTFPIPVNMPERIKFRSSLRLSIPFDKLSADRLPQKGTEFSFTGQLEKEKDDAFFEPIWVFYGVGPNNGEVLIGIKLIDINPVND